VTLGFGLPLTAVFLFQACSVFLNSDATQCQGDTDCAHFGQTICDLSRHVCVPSPTLPVDGGAVDATLSCHSQSGCFQCTPTADQEFLSSCTDSTCIPFDNRRLSNLGPDGTLKPLP
jgi:hypothetical protein